MEDFNECSEPEFNDCGENSECINHFGGFRCACLAGYGDRAAGVAGQEGRQCESCPADHCAGRGACSIEAGERVCACTGNYYGAQCQLDGEVLAVAIGASAAALIIIVLTLICLCMWSRRWKREQQKSDLRGGGLGHTYMVGGLAPPPAYLSKLAGATYHRGPPDPHQLRWTHHLDHAGQNIYAVILIFSY